MCLIPHNLLDLQMLLAILSLKKVSKKRKVSKAPSRDGREAVVAYFAFFAYFVNEGGDFTCTGFKSGRYLASNELSFDIISC